MPLVQLGNDQAVDRGRPIEGRQVTTVTLPSDDEGWSHNERVAAITAVEGSGAGGASTHGVWRTHSTAERPRWVESDDPALAQAVADHYGCPIGRPRDW